MKIFSSAEPVAVVSHYTPSWRKLSAQERGLSKMQNFIRTLASLSLLMIEIEGEVSQVNKLSVI
jgi:hypothetical protein